MSSAVFVLLVLPLVIVLVSFLLYCLSGRGRKKDR
jgi:hypothetical protein